MVLLGFFPGIVLIDNASASNACFAGISAKFESRQPYQRKLADAVTKLTCLLKRALYLKHFPEKPGLANGKLSEVNGNVKKNNCN